MTKHVLYLTNCYALPDQISSGPATRHFYHVQSMVAQGLYVRVVTSDQSTVSSGKLTFDQTSDNPQIQSISIPAIQKNGIVPRITYHMRFLLKTFFSVWRAPKSDLIVASVPALFLGWIGYFVSKRQKVPFLLDVRDLWSDSLATTSLAKIPFFLKLNEWIEKTLYKKANMICCTSRAQMETVKAYARNKKPVLFVPNGVDPEVSQTAEIHPFIHEIRKKYRFVGLYAGKHSKYTELDNLIEAAKKLQNDDFAIVLLGGGYTKGALKEQVRQEGLQNVFLHDPVPKSEVAGFEAGADMFFINYSPEQAWAKVLPNKVFDYMYWNKPIIAAVVPGEITRVLEESKAGLGVPPREPGLLAEAVQGLLSNSSPQIQSREYLMKHFDRRETVQKFFSMVLQLT